MTLLATKIAEVVDEAIATNGVAVWRGVLDTQEWKILVQYDANSLTIKVKRRDNGDGEPE